jgi:cell wall-associated NlpC family hydrolase
MPTPAQITAAALSMTGTPFHAQGRLPGVGLDCIGVMVCTAIACGIQIKDRIDYPLRANGELKKELDARLVRVYGAPQEGDILMMRFSGEPHHVAIYISENRIVHAYTGVRECVVQSYTDYWREKVRGVYRFPEVQPCQS